MRKKILDAAVGAGGILSFASMALSYAALHDIWHDYASPEVWGRAGQSLPEWYSPVNRCPLEWRALQVGFLLMLVFHILFFVRRLADSKEKTAPAVSRPEESGSFSQ